MDFLINEKYITSKSLGTISITHDGIKKIENLLECGNQSESDSHDFGHFKPIIDLNAKNEILEIQKLRYTILKNAYEFWSQNVKVVNIFELGKPLGINNEKLERIYFYLEDERLIDFFALGGKFYVTEKGREFIEKNPNMTKIL